MEKTAAFKLGDWVIHPLRGELERDGNTEHIQPKSMEVLACLVEHFPDVVERDTLLATVWGANAVSDEPLTRCIAELRKKLGDDRANPTYIATIPKRGYRLLAPVTEVKGSPGKVQSASRAEPVPASVPVPDRSIAVLPFIDLSATGDQKYLAEGIADEILIMLTKVPDLKVSARVSTHSLRDEDFQTIRTTLGVRFILEGSVLRQQNIVKVNVRMTDTTDGYQALAESFKVDGSDLLLLGETIASGVMESLPETLREHPPPDWRQMEAPGTEAFDLYLKGRYAFNQRDLTRAAALMKEACAAGGNFPALYTAYAAVLALMPSFYLTPNPQATFGEARALAEKALAMEPDSPLALSVLGKVCMGNHQWAEAAHHLEKALEINPRETTARQWYGTLMLLRGKPSLALKQYQMALEHDPISPAIFRDMGIALYADGQNQKAEDLLIMARALSENDTRMGIPTILGMIYLQQGRYSKALDEMRRDHFMSALGEDEVQQVVEAVASFKTRGEKSSLMEGLESRIPSPALAARLYALTGNPEAAIACLRVGFQDADPWVTFSFIDPALRELRESTAGKLLFQPCCA